MLGNHRLTASLNRRSVRVPQSDTLHLYQLSCQWGLHQLTGLLCIWLFSVGDSQMECGKISYFSFLPAFQPLPAPQSRTREPVQFALSNGVDARNRSSASLALDILMSFAAVSFSASVDFNRYSSKRCFSPTLYRFI